MEKVEDKITEINSKLDRVMDYVILMDKLTNREAAKKLGVNWHTFKSWLAWDGFPRLDHKHVSLSQVQRYMSENITKKKK
jgi:uncharacterized protein YjcR